MADKVGSSRDDTLINKVISERWEEIQNVIVSNIEERIQKLLPLHGSAEKGYIEKLTVTASFLIEHANSVDDFIPVAAIIYSNVEENLIYGFKLNHVDKKFVMSVEEYNQVADSLIIDGRLILKKFDCVNDCHGKFSPNVVERDEFGSAVLVEMPPIVRFFKAGLTSAQAKTASDYWTILNKVRHKSPDNEEYLKHYLSGTVQSRKEFFKKVLEFFKEYGLYTKE